ncbi:L-type lectin-domain containing receptor kinase IX.1-like protein [Tanacetum coccineum]
MDSSSAQRETVFIILSVSCSVFFLPLSESTSFEFTSFSHDTKNIAYSGDAKPSFGVVQLNTVGLSSMVGHAKYADPVQIWDIKSGKLSDFTSHFTFIVDTEGRSPFGDCFSFFLAPVGFQIPPNSAGAFLGLFNSTDFDSDQNQMLFVEFDSFVNPWDPQYGPHVGINVNSVRSRNDTAWNTSLHSGHSADAWVSYNATTQFLSLSWRYGAENNSHENSSLSYNVDLRKVLPEWVTIGFSGTTGVNMEKHILQYWEFSSSLNATQKREDNSNKFKLPALLAACLGVVIIAGIVAYAIYWKIRRKSIPKLLDTIPLTSMTDNDLERGAGPKRFSFRDLALATNNFSDDLKLGEGGFGCVYKGYLSREGIVVAVKKISQGSKQGKKVLTEVKIISPLRHKNVGTTSSLGANEQAQLPCFFLRSFLPKASLDMITSSTQRSLEMRYSHAKLETLGLARFMDQPSRSANNDSQSRTLLATNGPLEYVTTGKAQIACGRMVINRVDPNSDPGLVRWVWDLHGKNELISGVDLMLNNKFNEKEVRCLMTVGLWCAHPDWSLRPSIGQAIQVLKFESALPNLPMKIPVPMPNAALCAPQTSSAGTKMTKSR